MQVQKGYPHRACRIAVDAVAVGAKRSIHTVDTVIWVVGTTAFRAKRSIHAVGHAADAVDTVDTVEAVGVGSKKVNLCSGHSKYGWWGKLLLVQKGKAI